MNKYWILIKNFTYHLPLDWGKYFLYVLFSHYYHRDSKIELNQTLSGLHEFERPQWKLYLPIAFRIAKEDFSVDKVKTSLKHVFHL